ncbi:MAG: hypothetical protein IJ057_06545 [Bacteroidales bacterium]|nr:hypothetical protein [Bacteroidales bacterium]
MRNNEVMIGDWVMFQDPDTNETEMHQMEQADFAASDNFFDRFNPIPITAEIIEANNFRGYGNVRRIYINLYDFDNHSTIEYRLDQNWFDLKRMVNRQYAYQLKCEVHYVHEMQHLLRVAGLNEMADNFVITKGGAQ